MTTNYPPGYPANDPANDPTGQPGGEPNFPTSEPTYPYYYGGHPYDPYGGAQHYAEQYAQQDGQPGPYVQYGQPAPYGASAPVPAPVPVPPSRRRRKGLMAAGIGAIAAALVVGGVAVANTGTSTVAGSGSIVDQGGSSGDFPGQGGSSSGGTTNPGGGAANPGGGTTNPGGGTTNPQPGGGSSGGLTAATDTQQIGIVTVVSVLKYQNAEGAGTGMVLSSDGEILTNNHVVNGATSITVTVETTGKSYKADVVGTDPSDDVAVVQLRNASGLQTAKLAQSAADVKVGDAVTGVGNAGGTGRLTQASGQVTALDQAITASDETGQDSEQLTGLIQIDAPIIAGDSGGPLYDASGDIIGIDTAASAKQQTSPEAYAIPIEHALGIADKIESGVETTSIHIGVPGFLGVSTKDGQGGVAVSGLLEGGPAAKAGITSGSTITAINGQAVSTAKGLRSVLAAKDPGTKVTVTWTGSDGSSHTATVKLGTGPAD